MAYRLSTALRNALLEREALVRAVSMHVNVITFGDGDGSDGRDTINAASGLDEHKPGDKLTVLGSGGGTNDKTVEILSVAANKIEVSPGTFVTEDATSLTIVLASARGGSYNDIFRNGIMRIFSGAQPATADDIETGTLLVEISNGGVFTSGLPEFGLNFGETASGAVLGKAADETWQGEAVATATAGYFRFYPNDVDNHVGADGGGETKVRFDGAIATSGAQLNMSNTSITDGGTTTIDSVAVTLPTA